MGTLVTRKDIPPWVKIPEDLEDPEVFQVNTLVLESLFGRQRSRMPHIEQVSQSMFELKTLESSELTEVLIYGSANQKLRAKWMLQCMAERYRLRQEKGMLKLQESMKTLELDQCLE
ncbi:developmental pluripotency-associated 5 protein [Mastomys coucha]|uniref:developmental pluripotency-associated 5 protein n=1 Tax=Mastomys coucha TaxID=35658 RepID=UPI001261C371|nr:developmental pluripotency-associated 5 protein [Mastomys coucha]